MTMTIVSYKTFFEVLKETAQKGEFPLLTQQKHDVNFLVCMNAF